MVQQNKSPELKGYLVGIPTSLITSLGVVLIFYLWLIPKFLIESKNYLLLLCLGITTLVLFGGIKLLVWQWVNNIPLAAYPPFVDLFLDGINTSAINASFPLGILITKKYYEEQVKNASIEQRRKEGELNLLRTQVNPHFLFNSLNTLDALIECNPAKAQIYLKALSQLYRNLIITKDQEIIPLHKELETLKDYFTMIKIRFGDAYHFEIIDRFIHKNEFLPVAALQILVENVIKHNSPDSFNTVLTNIKIEHEHIIIENNKVTPKTIAESFGTGLKNLAERYKFITNKEIQIIQDNDSQFSISIPIIHLKKWVKN
ncbi:MAG: histidine kinase [Bacteroidota bacterium]